MTTAIRDLEASPAQAAMVAANAFAWRSGLLLVPLAILVPVAALALGAVDLRLAVLLAATATVAPLAVAFAVTFPLGFFAVLQTWYRGSHEAQVRFGGTNFGFLYYGWRYAFRARQRPWGAMTREEKQQANPERAGL